MKKYYSSQVLNFDFNVVDSTYFNMTSFEKDIQIRTQQTNFDLLNLKGDSIKLTFDCTGKDPNDCSFNGYPYKVYYSGVSDRTGIHVAYEVREIASLYFLKPEIPTKLSVLCQLDYGYIPVFTPNYLVLWSSFGFDESESIIAVYAYTSDLGENKVDLSKSFKYIGSFRTKNWEILDLKESEKPDSFLVKSEGHNGKNIYLEMTIKGKD